VHEPLNIDTNIVKNVKNIKEKLQKVKKSIKGIRKIRISYFEKTNTNITI
jgi:hypothetical protein